MKLLSIFWSLLLVFGAGFFTPSNARAQSADETFGKLTEEYIQGYLACRPQLGTTLGFHEYDGKVTDFSKASLDAELARLRQLLNKRQAPNGPL